NHPQATLQQLAQMAGSVGVSLSAQGLDQRFPPAAAQCLRRMLEEAVKEVVTAHPVAIPLVQRFCGVYLLDSSTIVLPDSLAALWQGCGGNTQARTQAARHSANPVRFVHGSEALVPGYKQDARMIGRRRTKPPSRVGRCAWLIWAISAWQPCGR